MQRRNYTKKNLNFSLNISQFKINLNHCQNHIANLSYNLYMPYKRAETYQKSKTAQKTMKH
ncbi:hypothetical protein [Helicobacter sp. MIT 05-5294]|uniref:hypothetical protein n=1 Tax=Helicobacter sp. MIT 05-5294 TaxID=1548150 RepID=UPI0010FF0FF0|nr:hypothetical protein [Helicobacter sp. MIT 05-5294]TLD85788.1 hypothetical protein LS69_007790 [Helicobacter sp. MIT 05-5294]